MSTPKKKKQEKPFPSDKQIKDALAKIGIDQVIGTFSAKSSDEGVMLCVGFTQMEAYSYSLKMAKVAAQGHGDT